MLSPKPEHEQNCSLQLKGLGKNLSDQETIQLNRGRCWAADYP